MRNSVRLQAALLLSLLSSVATAQTASNVVCSGCVQTSDIATGPHATTDLANGSVTSDKIADDTIKPVDLASNSVTTAKIANGSIWWVDLSSPLQYSLGGEIANATTLRAY